MHKERKNHRDYNSFEPAVIQGGTGEGHNGVGLVLKAGKKIVNNASIICSVKANEFSSGDRLENIAQSSQYVSKTTKTRTWYGKRVRHKETRAIVQPAQIISTQGKNLVKEGGVYSVGGIFSAKDGTKFNTERKMEFHPLVTKDKLKYSESHLFGLIKKSHHESHQERNSEHNKR